MLVDTKLRDSYFPRLYRHIPPDYVEQHIKWRQLRPIALAHFWELLYSKWKGFAPKDSIFSISK